MPFYANYDIRFEIRIILKVIADRTNMFTT